MIWYADLLLGKCPKGNLLHIFSITVKVLIVSLITICPVMLPGRISLGHVMPSLTSKNCVEFCPNI